MKQNRPLKDLKKIAHEIVGENPDLSAAAALFRYRGNLQPLDLLAFYLNTTPPNDPARILVDVIKDLITNAPTKKDWEKREDLAFLIGRIPFHPAKGSRLRAFNEIARSLPLFLQIQGYENSAGEVEIHATHMPLNLPYLLAEDSETRDKLLANWPTNEMPTRAILWAFWEVYFRKIDFGRLKQCPECGEFFVDHTKNKTQMRWPPKCNWKYWNWSKKKEKGHNLPNEECPNCGKRFTPRYKDKGVLKTRKRCPNCGAAIEPQKDFPNLPPRK